jgi:hypothetical protein
MKEIIDIVHKSIYSFFDVCEDGKEEPMSDKDKLLLNVNKAICTNLKALEQETCGDVISREAVLKEQYRIDDSATLSARDVVNVEDIEQLPSVTPAEKIGQWVFNDTVNEHAHCSECGHGNVDLVDGKTHNYCECCGAKMEMPENRDGKMSRESAIRYCDEYLATNNVSNIDKEFLKTAKEALQQEPKEEVLSKLRAEIEEMPKTYPFVNHLNTYVKDDDVIKIIDKYEEEESEG